jgi:hypothetical protein
VNAQTEKVATKGPWRVRGSEGITIAFGVRGFDYDELRLFKDVDHEFTRFLPDVYRDRIWLVSTPIEPPIDRVVSVLAPVESRAFVTFVDPSPHQGLLPHPRFADMLGSKRSDIPISRTLEGDFRGGKEGRHVPRVKTDSARTILERLDRAPACGFEPYAARELLWNAAT